MRFTTTVPGAFVLVMVLVREMLQVRQLGALIPLVIPAQFALRLRRALEGSVCMRRIQDGTVGVEWVVQNIGVHDGFALGLLVHMNEFRVWN